MRERDLYNNFNDCELFFFTDELNPTQLKKKKYKLNQRVFNKKNF